MDRAVPILPCDDLILAKEFYQKLGFSVTCEETDDGISGIACLERGTIAITLDSPMPGHGRNACVSIEVADADDFYRGWSRVVDIKDPPRNEDWGARTFSLQDPFDNSIFVIGPPACP